MLRYKGFAGTFSLVKIWTGFLNGLTDSYINFYLPRIWVVQFLIHSKIRTDSGKTGLPPIIFINLYF